MRKKLLHCAAPALIMTTRYKVKFTINYREPCSAARILFSSLMKPFCSSVYCYPRAACTFYRKTSVFGIQKLIVHPERTFEIVRSPELQPHETVALVSSSRWVGVFGSSQRYLLQEIVELSPGTIDAVIPGVYPILYCLRRCAEVRLMATGLDGCVTPRVGYYAGQDEMNGRQPSGTHWWLINFSLKPASLPPRDYTAVFMGFFVLPPPLFFF